SWRAGAVRPLLSHNGGRQAPVEPQQGPDGPRSPNCDTTELSLASPSVCGEDSLVPTPPHETAMTPSPLAPHSRRHFLASGGMGLGSLAVAWLLNEDGRLGAEPIKPELDRRAFDLRPRKPHFEPRARAMISLFMQGGP